MATKEDLEAALSTTWDLKNLAAYGDYLQAQGDRRGDLIALELQKGGAKEDDVERWQRWSAVVDEWLGEELASSLTERAQIEYGFIEDLDLSNLYDGSLALLGRVLASPAGPYLRGVSIDGDAPFIRAAVAGLTSRRHMWLRQLAI
jgi:hypothetical protein